MGRSAKANFGSTACGRGEAHTEKAQDGAAGSRTRRRTSPLQRAAPRGEHEALRIKGEFTRKSAPVSLHAGQGCGLVGPAAPGWSPRRCRDALDRGAHKPQLVRWRTRLRPSCEPRRSGLRTALRQAVRLLDRGRCMALQPSTRRPNVADDANAGAGGEGRAGRQRRAGRRAG